MTSITKKFKAGLLVMVSLAAILTSCNKDVEPFPFTPDPAPTSSIAERLAATPNDSLFNRLVIRAGLTTTLSNRNLAFTIFVADNPTMRAAIDVLSGGATVGQPDAVYSAFISTALTPAAAAGIVNYYTVPQRYTTAQFVHPFPNLELLNNITVLPGNPFARLRVHVSKNPSTGFFYVNNIPLSATDSLAGLSVIHHMAALVPPPQRMIWERINTDADLTIFKAALQRADSGYAVTSPASLIGGMQNFGADFTVLAPSNAAMRNVLIFISQGTLTPLDTDNAFINYLGSASINSITVRGIAAYHLPAKRVAPPAPPAPQDSVMMPHKIFTVNVPTTVIMSKTMVNNPVPPPNNPGLPYMHPGLAWQATFAGPMASAVTVKGLANPTASNIAINPTPDLRPSYGAVPPAPFAYTGTSDQNYINGVLHKIDQVLIPQ